VLIKRLATGGMAELFLAQEPPSAELIVIKRILPYLSEEPEFVQMFLDEARIAAQLHHPNVVQVFELGRINESIFLAMEYVEGVDLRRILAEETKFSAAVPYAVASRICSAVAAGLDHAHNSKGVDGRPLGLIHRDVSPQNVMVGYNGAVKLVDFGIAKAGAFAERSKPGVIKGKFLYLSPEQVMQEKLDHRSDIFALGVMLYEITTGRTPFARATTENILYAIRSENPSPPHLIRDDYPQELSRIVMKCLVKDRNQRYQRASQVHADLEALLDSGVMRQSNDVAAYVARLLGEEEERTQLHVPISGGRKDASSTPSGLAARPKRRSPSGQNLPSAVDREGEELATEMSRPRDLQAPPEPALGEEDEDAPTAVGTTPGRLAPTGSPLARSLSRLTEAREEEEDSQATAHERLGRGRRTPALPVRKAPDPLASLERRRGPPVFDEDEEPSNAQSVSTVNDRGPAWSAAAASLSDELAESTAELPHPPGRARSAAPPHEEEYGEEHDAEHDDADDESTSTYAPSYTQPGVRSASRPAPPSRMRLLRVALAALLVVVAVGMAWLSLTGPKPSPDSNAPPRSPAPSAANTDPAVKPASPTVPAPSTPAPGSNSPDTPTGSTPTPPTAAVTPGAPAGVGAPGEGGTPSTTSEVKMRVYFDASPTTVLKLGKKVLKPNKSVSLPPGKVTLYVRCAGSRAPQGFRDFLVESNPSGEVTLKVSCRKSTRK
jgi:eukaryotic-like serine/threonine-protein kinase